MFKSIKHNSSAEIVERKSKFIANIFYIESKEEAEKLIKEVNKKYHDARHNCYAYRVITSDGIIEKASDDGEPSAGGPGMGGDARHPVHTADELTRGDPEHGHLPRTVQLHDMPPADSGGCPGRMGDDADRRQPARHDARGGRSADMRSIGRKVHK